MQKDIKIDFIKELWNANTSDEISLILDRFEESVLENESINVNTILFGKSNRSDVCAICNKKINKHTF